MQPQPDPGFISLKAEDWHLKEHNSFKGQKVQTGISLCCHSSVERQGQDNREHLLEEVSGSGTLPPSL